MKIGDVVKLKSASTPMTIQGVKDNTVNCIWFDNEYLRRECFMSDRLELVVG